MSVCQSGQVDEDSGSEEVTATAAAVRDIYKQKPASKVVRVLTVLAYLLSVSLAAILLSVYYVCVWRSPELPRLNDTGGPGLAARRDPLHSHYNHTAGGSGGGVSALDALGTDPAPTTPASETTTDLFGDSTTDSPTVESLNSTFGSGTNDTDVT